LVPPKQKILEQKEVGCKKKKKKLTYTIVYFQNIAPTIEKIP